jgi:arylsulfatase A-like enzyme
VIVTADHGESFDPSWLTHGSPYLYNSLIHIPLLVHLPGQKQGSRISQAAEQVDLLPTILDAAGVRAPSWSEGTSLVPALDGKPLPQRFLFSMNLESNSAFQPISQGTVAIIDNDFKFIKRLETNNVSLYRYRTDPFDQNNVVDSEPAVTGRMKSLLADKLRTVNGQSMPAH